MNSNTSRFTERRKYVTTPHQRLEAKMLSDARLSDIIDDTGDAIFLNQWLIAKAFWNRQKLERTRERVCQALEKCRVEVEQGVQLGTGRHRKRIFPMLPIESALGEDACYTRFVSQTLDEHDR